MRKLAALVRLLFAITGPWCAFTCSLALADAEVLDPNSERFMEVVLNEGRAVLSNTLSIHRAKSSSGNRNQQDVEWYFPIGEYSDALGLSVQVSAVVGVAEGFILSESRKFRLSIPKCEVEYDGRQEKFP
jgi:hypothetical protein